MKKEKECYKCGEIYKGMVDCEGEYVICHKCGTEYWHEPRN